MSARGTALLPVGAGLVDNPVISAGEGSSVAYLHGPWGQEWLGYLDDLAEKYHVVAPAHPGSEEPKDLAALDNLWELVPYYDELFDNLGFGKVTLIGHSFGGMIAAEYAAAHPDRVEKLVLIDSMGLWLPDNPVADFVTASTDDVRNRIWADPDGAEASAQFALPSEPAAATAEMVRRFMAVGSAAHFAYPIPDRGLGKRLRRIKAETLVIWGREDKMVDPEYAAVFASEIARCKVEMVDGAAHYPHVEQRRTVSELTLDFLSGVDK